MSDMANQEVSCCHSFRGAGGPKRGTWTPANSKLVNGLSALAPDHRIRRERRERQSTRCCCYAISAWHAAIHVWCVHTIEAAGAARAGSVSGRWPTRSLTRSCYRRIASIQIIAWIGGRTDRADIYKGRNREIRSELRERSKEMSSDAVLTVIPSQNTLNLLRPELRESCEESRNPQWNILAAILCYSHLYDGRCPGGIGQRLGTARNANEWAAPCARKEDKFPACRTRIWSDTFGVASQSKAKKV